MSNLLRKFSVDSPANPIDQKYVGLESASTNHKRTSRKVTSKQILVEGKPAPISLIHLIFSSSFNWKNYLLQIPTLLLACLSFWVSAFILRNILPSTIQNVLIPNFYLPLAVCIFLGCFFGCWYISQNLRRSSFFATITFGLLELQLHQHFRPLWVILLILPLLLIELLLTYRIYHR